MWVKMVQYNGVVEMLLGIYTGISSVQILSARLGRDPKDIVKLDANENPYGPPPEVFVS